MRKRMSTITPTWAILLTIGLMLLAVWGKPGLDNGARADHKDGHSPGNGKNKDDGDKDHGDEEQPSLDLRYKITLEWSTADGGLNDHGDVVMTEEPGELLLYLFEEDAEIDLNQMIATQFKEERLDVDPELLREVDGDEMPRHLDYADVINNKGQVAGAYEADDGRFLPYRYTPPSETESEEGEIEDVPGCLEILGSFPNEVDNTIVVDINDAGDLLVQDHGVSRTFVYLDGIGLVSDEELKAAANIDYFDPRALNDNRMEGLVQLAGRYHSEKAGWVRYNLPLDPSESPWVTVLDPSHHQNQLTADGINDFGDLAGWEYSSTLTPEAFLYQDGGGKLELGALDGHRYSQARDVNTRGDVIGSSKKGQVSDWYEFLYTEGAMHALGDLIDDFEEDEFHVFSVEQINDQRQIRARLYHWENGAGSVVLTPYSVE